MWIRESTWSSISVTWCWNRTSKQLAVYFRLSWMQQYLALLLHIIAPLVFVFLFLPLPSLLHATSKPNPPSPYCLPLTATSNRWYPFCHALCCAFVSSKDKIRLPLLSVCWCARPLSVESNINPSTAIRYVARGVGEITRSRISAMGVAMVVEFVPMEDATAGLLLCPPCLIEERLACSGESTMIMGNGSPTHHFTQSNARDYRDENTLMYDDYCIVWSSATYAVCSVITGARNVYLYRVWMCYIHTQKVNSYCVIPAAYHERQSRHDTTPQRENDDSTWNLQPNRTWLVPCYCVMG